ncbi:MAG TPA: GAF domain-containing protein, partial [Candidatus Binatia bacterium]|nr:GAF domain-containing protein [Candidatus Binatia bacterium]
DLQSTEATAFSEEDSATLSILADQVAIAIQNAMSHEQSLRALRAAKAESRQSAGQAWKQYGRRMERQGYHYDGVRSAPLKEGSGVSESGNVVDLPVRLRGLTIGHLKLSYFDGSHRWTEDELAMAEATAERVAIALEGARLLDEAQKRAAREAFLSEMTARLGASFQIDSILRDTVEELGETLKHSTITFQLVNPSDAIGADGKPNGSSAPEQGSE